MNHVGLVGRMTKDPVLKKLSEGRIHTSFTIAINRNFRNNEGSIEADFVLCSAWGKLAERIAHYCGKGSLVGVNGRLQTRTYINKENKKIYTTEVAVEDVRFYMLKVPEGQNLQKSNPTQVAESAATFETGEFHHASKITQDFELPTTEEGLPIR